jgi:hypothetical protein
MRNASLLSLSGSNEVRIARGQGSLTPEIYQRAHRTVFLLLTLQQALPTIYHGCSSRIETAAPRFQGSYFSALSNEHGIQQQTSNTLPRPYQVAFTTFSPLTASELCEKRKFRH